MNQITPDSSHDKSRPQSLRQLAIPLILVSAFLLVCCGLLASVNFISQTQAFGWLPAELCAGYTTTPRFQMGFYWSMPLFSYLPSLAMAPTHVCLFVPYQLFTPLLTWLPREIVFPP